MKPALAETYVEPTDAEWNTKFLLPAMERKEFLETEKDLSCEWLVGECEDQLLETFTWFLGLTWEDQQRVAHRLKEGLAKVSALRERNRERAQRMLERASRK
jgi:hypothetical protein